MICVICRDAELVRGITSISFEREKMKLLMNDVPVRICPSCGECYVEEDIVLRLLQTASDLLETGVMETRFEHNVNS